MPTDWRTARCLRLAVYAPKSVGNGGTFPRNLITQEEVRRGVALLADQVAVRLRRHRMKATTLQVTIRDPNFKDICRQRPLPAPHLHSSGS